MARTVWRVIGGIGLTILGATGSTALFSAIKGLVTYSNDAAFSFFVGMLLLIPCIFIWRGMYR